MKVKVVRYFITILTIFICSTNIQAQNIVLKVHCIDSSANAVKEIQPLKQSFATVDACLLYVQQLPTMLQAKGYISAAIDLVKQFADTIAIQLFVGKKYFWKRISIEPQYQPLLQKLGIDTFQLTNQIIEPLFVTKLQDALLNYFENNGYPFAVIKFDSVLINANYITAALTINKGIYYILDSIRIIGNAKINKSFLYSYLSVFPNSIFSSLKHQAIDQKIQALPYLQQVKPATITMLGSKYLIDLFIDNKRSNQVNAIVGFMPANQQLGGKLLFTVDANLNLQNAFASGETIAFNWQQIQPQSPRLHLNYIQPYVFKTALGLDFGFDLYKRDSSFLNIQTNIGVELAYRSKQKIKVFLQSLRTNLLQVDTLAVKLTKQLPDIIDLSIHKIGIAYQFNNSNYFFNPQSGNELNCFIAVGSKQIRPNNTIVQLKDAGFNFSKLYDSITTNTYQLSMQLKAAHYFNLKKQSVLKAAVQAGWIESATMYRNELFQIGGYKILRGFDEESIFTNKYAVATIEYRYLLGLNAYLAGFTDVGYSTNSITQLNNTYIGAGMGMSIETKQGILNLSFAAGKRNDLPVNFKQSKIHIGFVSLF